MHIKFDIQNENLEWYKKRSLFATWTSGEAWYANGAIALLPPISYKCL